MLPLKRELAALKFLDSMSAHLKDVREPQKALRHALRDTREFFQAAQGCIAALEAGRSEADLRFTLPKDASWNLSALTRFIRHTNPPVEPEMMIAPLRRRDSAWGAIALVRPKRAYDRYDRRLLARIATMLSASIHRIDRDRLLDVRDRIDRKIMEQIQPKDLFYQILDGIRSLTHYDHSSALLIREENDASLRVVAEQIAWTKAKSRHIGLRIPMTSEAAALLLPEQVYGFNRHGDSWEEWKGQSAGGLAVLLDYNRADDGGGERLREGSMICAPLVTRDSLVGVLKIAARYPEQLKPFDAELVEHFRSQAAVAIQNLHRTESLRARVLTAERSTRWPTLLAACLTM